MRMTPAVVVSLLASVAVAAPLLPGTSLENPALGTATPDFTNALPANYANYVLVTTLVSPYVGAFAGSVTTNVWRDPIGSGGDDTLTFEYIFTNTTVGSPQDIVRATIGDPTFPWLGYAIDAGADGSGTSTPAFGSITWSDGDPNFILRDPTFSGEGLTIQWMDGVFNGTVIRNPSNVSARVWFDTNATAYQPTNVGIQDTGLVASASGYAPKAASNEVIPEPGTLALLGLGLAAIARRRRKS